MSVKNWFRKNTADKKQKKILFPSKTIFSFFQMKEKNVAYSTFGVFLPFLFRFGKCLRSAIFLSKILKGVGYNI